MSACKIITVVNTIPLFKGEEPSKMIELLNFVETGYQVVSMIGLHKRGEKVLFIEPDYNLPETELFESYHAPNGDKKKSKLGANGRIKAVKFNLHTGNNVPVLSYGIVMPLATVELYYPETKKNWNDLEKIDKILGITKIEPSVQMKGSVHTAPQTRKPFPNGLYKTDETNINNLWGELSNILTFPLTMIGSHKIDGSSITIYCKVQDGKIVSSGICSRNNEILPTYLKKGKPKKLSWWNAIRVFYENALFGKTFIPESKLYHFEEKQSTDPFITIGTPYLKTLEGYCLKHNTSMVLRGELNGQGLRGSGNPHNPSVKEAPNIKFFGIDYFNSYYHSIPVGEEIFDKTIKELGFNRCEVLFRRKIRSKGDITRIAKETFQKKKDKGILIEGVVVRDLESTFSAKVMNLEYDLKKK